MRCGHKLSHVFKFIVNPLVHNILAVNTWELVIVPIDDKSIDNKIFEAIIVALDHKSFKTSEWVAMSRGEVAFRTEEIVMAVYSC